jgi:hypothetical protein
MTLESPNATQSNRSGRESDQRDDQRNGQPRRNSFQFGYPFERIIRIDIWSSKCKLWLWRLAAHIAPQQRRS